MSKALLPQKCPLVFIYASWLIYSVGALYLLFAVQDVTALLLWLLIVPLSLWGYIRVFPRVSHVFGYGRVTDQDAQVLKQKRTRVVMYGALGCPFCPIVAKRLRSLQEGMGFELEEIDVTLRPELARAKRIGAVPVVEVEGRRRAGCATTRELVALISNE